METRVFAEDFPFFKKKVSNNPGKLLIATSGASLAGID